MAEVKSRIVAFTGPKEGVGKTQIALNLALGWAGSKNRETILVCLDPLCRPDASYFLNLPNPPSLAELVQLRKGVESLPPKLLRGRIPTSTYGVGVLPMAKKRTEALGLSPALILPVLASLSESYDLFLDIDPFFPIQLFSFDLADLVFWVLLPQRTHLEASFILLREVRNLHFPLDRFSMLVNQSDIPGALVAQEIERSLQTVEKEVTAYLPWEDRLPEFANLQKALWIDRPHSPWIRSLKGLLPLLENTPPVARDWNAERFAVGGFSSAADMFWRGGPGAIEDGSPAQPFPASAGRTSAPRGSSRPSQWEGLKNKLHKQVVQALETERIRLVDNPEEAQGLRSKVEEIIKNLLGREQNLELTREQRSRFLTELLDEILGLGPLEDLMRDPSVTEIMVNQPHQIYIERGGRLSLSDKQFRDEEQIVQVIKRIVAPIGRRIDESVPMVDARLKDGSRVNAIIPPLAVSGPTLTIRRFSAKPLGTEELLRLGSVTEPPLQFLRACVQIRKNVLISGGTGTGKTTFLNLLSSFVPSAERIVTVEDVAELKLQQEHWVRLESRPPNIEGKGEITIRDLVRNCLRMRPDRIVVGECRGAEALDMLQAMNTGHEGSLSTIHANSPRDALSRLEGMCLMAGSDLPIWALREMVSSAIHLIVQLVRFSDGSRKVTSVSEITGRDENTILMTELFRFEQKGIGPRGDILGELAPCGHPPRFFPEFKTKGIELPVALFSDPAAQAR